ARLRRGRRPRGGDRRDRGRQRADPPAHAARCRVARRRRRRARRGPARLPADDRAAEPRRLVAGAAGAARCGGAGMSAGERLRSLVVFAVLAAAALAVLLRLADLQLTGPSALAATRQGPPLETSTLRAPRGRILDRNGEPLAYDRPLYELRV